MALTFKPEQFTDTKFETAADKARFANLFVRFVKGGYKWEHFTDPFYNKLMNRFGHIAHYNRLGFYEEFFTDTARQYNFIRQTLDYPCYNCDHSDVEKAIQKWVKDNDIIRTVSGGPQDG